MKRKKKQYLSGMACQPDPEWASERDADTLMRAEEIRAAKSRLAAAREKLARRKMFAEAAARTMARLSKE